ncbi:MAG: hypothetical protein OES69_15755 [Myxococcales bacterium]|nr:hypothetical protein [Myxococcales bacterium]MDH3845400.1 hypothetical protein [Myxococcales bacterium]
MRWSIILLIAISLAGCNNEESASTEEAPATETPRDANEAPTAPGEPTSEPTAEPSETAPPTLKLVKPGKKPRRALRWSIEAGQKERLTMRVDTELEAVMVVLNAKQAPRSVAFELTLQTEEGGGEGPRVVSFTVDEARLLDTAKTPPKALEARKEAVAAMKGFGGTYRIDSLGTVEEVVIDLPSDASRELWGISGDLEWALRQLSAPFPEKPIGTGAKWTIERGVEQDGVDASEVSKFQLTKLRKQLVTLKTKVQQSAAPQNFRNPGSPIDAELTEFAAEGSGKVTWDPTRLVPRSGKMTLSVTKEMEYEFEQKIVKSRTITRRTLTIPGERKSRP